MATQTLKIGASATVKATGESGIIIDVRNGLYEIKGAHPLFHAGEIQAVKVRPAQGKKIRINKESSIRKKQNAIYSILSREIKSTPATCEGFGKIEGCTKVATEIHHKGGRRGFLLIMSRFFSRQCANCHRKITTKSKMGIDLSLSLPINSSEPACFTKKEIKLIGQYGIRLPKSYVVCD